MLWLLLTIYLCVGSHKAGIGYGLNAAEGSRSSVVRQLIVVITWPLFYIFSKFLNKQ